MLVRLEVIAFPRRGELHYPKVPETSGYALTEIVLPVDGIDADAV
jgi:hypothetical protein